MQGSPKKHCGRCGDIYEPLHGGWSHGYAVREGMSGLRAGAIAGDPLHDSCYKSINRAKAKRKHDAAAAPAPPDSPPPLEVEPAAALGRPPATVDELNCRLHPPMASGAGAAAAAAAAATEQHPIIVDAYRTGPLDAQEQTALVSLLRRHLPPHDIATVHPPSGHDLTIARLPVPRKGSADAEHSTVDERARLEEKVLNTLSVPAAAAAAGDSARHLAAQREVIVKRHKTEYIDAVEHVTGLNIASRFTVDDLLELKKSTGMPWTMLREVKRFFAAKGLKLMSVSEQKVRAAMKEAAALYETGTYRYANDLHIAFVRCADPMKQLTAVLRAHAANGNLQQCAAVSGTALRLLCVGDKGGSYTKLMLCVLDVVDPLSPNNGVFLGMYEGEENYEIVANVFGPIFAQLAAMQSAPINVSPSPAPPAVAATTRATRTKRTHHVRASATLRGDPLKAAMRTAFCYRSADCRRCKRLTRVGVPSAAPLTDTPYRAIVLLYGGDIPWLSLLLGRCPVHNKRDTYRFLTSL